MKILIITQAFLDSTLPLARNLALNNNTVEVLVINYEITSKLFVFDFSEYGFNKGSISQMEIDKFIDQNYLNYLEPISLNFEFVPYGFKNTLKILLRITKIVSVIIKQNYDVIHFIQGSPLTLFLACFLPKSRIIFTLHEVTNHFGNTSLKSTYVLKFIKLFRLPVIFHSDISQRRFLEFTKLSNYVQNKTQVIKFGLFEMYKLIKTPKKPVELEGFEKENKTILLFFGRITPDKGLKNLILAMNIINQLSNKIHLIVAGSGKLDTDISAFKNITFINRYLSNDDIVFLNIMADIIVCPYLSASQSGIPMTSYLFGKPIIATKVGGFEEFIINGKTGILIDSHQPKDLAHAINKFVDTKSSLYKEIADAIYAHYSSGEYDWQNIAEVTYGFYKRFF